MCGHNGRSVDVDRVAARRFDDGNSGCQDVLAQVGRATNPILKIVFVENLDKTLSHGLQVTTRQAPIGDETLGKNQQVVGPTGQAFVSNQEYPADINQSVFLGADGGAIGE